MGQVEYWNSVAEEKNFTTQFQLEEFSQYVNKNSVILDIGCGYGRTLNELHQAGFNNLIGIDYSEEMIKRGKKLYPKINFKVANGAKLDIESNSVDSVILLGVLTCTAYNEDQKNLISEVNRILKPEGIIYINDFLVNDDERNVNRYNEFKEKYGVYGAFELPGGGAFRHQTEEWLNELLGIFNKKEFEKIVYTTMNGNKSNGFYYIGAKQG